MLQIPQIVGGVLIRFPTALRAMAMPLIIMALLGLGLLGLLRPWLLAETDAEKMAAASGSGPHFVPLLIFLLMLVGVWTGVIFAVRWHRYVIAGDRSFRWWTFPLGGPEWRYFGWWLLHIVILVAILIAVFMLISLPLLPSLMMAAEGRPVDTFLPSIVAAAIVISIPALWFAAFGLVLPATAVDHYIGGFGGSVRAAKGRYWRFAARLAIMGIIGSAVGALISQVGFLFAAWEEGLLGLLVLAIAYLLAVAANAALTVSALSFNYGEAFGWQPSAATPPAGGGPGTGLTGSPPPDAA